MTNKNQIELANYIKSVHEKLRIDVRKRNVDLAWKDHLENLENLEKYSLAMQQLAQLWKENSSTKVSDNSPKKVAQCRVQWISKEIENYYTQHLICCRSKELHLSNIWFNEKLPNFEEHVKIDQIEILDVGSCYNPLRNFPKFKVTAIDLCPNRALSVFKSDFLNVEILQDCKINYDIEKYEILSLPLKYFDCVVFSLYLEYLPTSSQRVKSCKKAYELLKTEGILVIVTPDSQHVGKNAKLMKNWRYTLGELGFLRIKFEKLNHVTCMVFRKAIDFEIPNHWSRLHKEDYMTFNLDIPQDKNIL
ncbi:S-adenosylmethionine sensor upstream of mTORC1 [Condylostylus longicornis]|uniref:S-adenosylmethionine sensor upstream of mTORC1 n=1 Tax=Condylostylus longicornis TaxID=2530218 RepID=UPI00244DD452|nr:S-adenosylmethionine sensor upstream of mTORC1 [Condylostylus longicornis]